MKKSSDSTREKLKKPWELLFEDKLGKDIPTLQEISIVLDQVFETTRNYLVYFSDSQCMNFNDTKLLYLEYGITLQDLKKYGIPYKERATNKTEPQISAKYRTLDTIEKFVHFKSPKIMDHSGLEEYKNSYLNSLNPYLHDLEEYLWVNDYLGKGKVNGISTTKLKHYHELHEVIYNLIEKKLKVVPLETEEIYSSEMQHKIYTFKLKVVKPLQSYVRILEITHKLHPSNDPIKVKQEALLLCSYTTFKHVVRCIYSKLESIKIYASSLQRPYHYAILDNKYTYTEYYRAHEMVLYPDMFFIERIENRNNNSKEFSSVYYNEFVHLMDQDFEITIDDLTNIFSKEAVESKSMQTYLSEKEKEGKISPSDAKSVMASFKQKSVFVQNLDEEKKI